MAADGSSAAAAEDRACAVSTRAEVEEALNQNALVMARLHRELDHRKDTELFLKRRLRRFDMDDIEKAWGTEPGVPNYVGGGSDEDDDAGAASSGTMGGSTGEVGAGGGKRWRKEPVCRACVNMDKVGHQNGSSHLRVPPCRLGPRKPAAKVKGKNPNAAESQGGEVPAEEVVGQGRRAEGAVGGSPDA